MIENQNLANLLNSISSILKKYENHAALTGENFNIFRLLNVQYDEVRTHSAILADLLNPKGSHGQGSIFLEKFVTQFGIKDFDFKNAKCEKEKYIGTKTLDTGGRIDIYIEDEKKNKIFIENKIYASDQENQVLRYINFDKSAHVFYLTLDGNEPSNYSKKDLKDTEDFQCLSYRYDIIQWLQLCKKEATDLPILRETITQYIYLLKILTNQSTDLIMSKEIIGVILKSDDALKAYFDSYNAMGNVLDEILDIFNKQLERLKSKLEGEYNKIELKFDVKRNKIYSGFDISTENMRKHNFSIRFEFGSKATRDLYFGFRRNDINVKDNPVEIIKERIRDGFSKKYGNEAQPNNVWWLAFQWHTSRNWDDKNYETYLQIYKDKNGIIEDIESKLNTLLKIAQSVDNL